MYEYVRTCVRVCARVRACMCARARARVCIHVSRVPQPQRHGPLLPACLPIDLCGCPGNGFDLALAG